MITTAFINIAFFIIDGVISLFPVGGAFPQAVHDAVTSIGGYAGILSPLVPLPTLATCVGIVFTVEITIFGYKSLKSFLSHIPFIGGR